MKHNLLSTQNISLHAKENAICWILRAEKSCKTTQKFLKSQEIDIPRPTKLSSLENDTHLLAISDDEAWLVSDTNEADNKGLEKLVQLTKTNNHVALIDNSAGYQQFTLSGNQSTALLTHLIAYDWESMETDKVVSTVMHSVPIVIYKLKQSEDYQILIRKSFIEFAINFIKHTADLIT